MARAAPGKIDAAANWSKKPTRNRSLITAAPQVLATIAGGAGGAGSCEHRRARSLPLEHLEARLDELDPAVEVVAYCRGPLCLLAPEAVALLRGRGRRARCLEDGLPEWRQAGLPVEEGIGTGSESGGLNQTHSSSRARRSSPLLRGRS